jgi:cytochrome c oxidase subunit IV
MIAKSQNVYSYGKNSALAFKKEFQKHIITAISAALGFLIALSWRTPIQNSVNWLIDNFGLNGYILYEFLSAVLITIFAVFVLMIVTQWEVKK